MQQQAYQQPVMQQQAYQQPVMQQQAYQQPAAMQQASGYAQPLPPRYPQQQPVSPSAMAVDNGRYSTRRSRRMAATEAADIQCNDVSRPSPLDAAAVDIKPAFSDLIKPLIIPGSKCIKDVLGNRYVWSISEVVDEQVFTPVPYDEDTCISIDNKISSNFGHTTLATDMRLSLLNTNKNVAEETVLVANIEFIDYGIKAKANDHKVSYSSLVIDKAMTTVDDILIALNNTLRDPDLTMDIDNVLAGVVNTILKNEWGLWNITITSFLDDILDIVEYTIPEALGIDTRQVKTRMDKMLREYFNNTRDNLISLKDTDDDAEEEKEPQQEPYLRDAIPYYATICVSESNELHKVISSQLLGRSDIRSIREDNYFSFWEFLTEKIGANKTTILVLRGISYMIYKTSLSNYTISRIM
jgi:hypothetical protein